MATVSANTHNKNIHDGDLLYPTDRSGVKVVNQGDIVMFDSTLNSANGGIRSALIQADMATYAGVALQNSQLNSLGDVLTTIMVAFKNVFMFKTTAAETYKHGDKVFLNETLDSQTIVKSTNTGARTVAVGFVVLPNENIMAGVLTITGATGTSIPVAVTANFPVASLA